MRSKRYFRCLAAMGLASVLGGCSPDQSEPPANETAPDTVQGETNATPSTMADNVTTFARSVTFNGEARRLWVYLPPEYASSTRRYDVVYMHDGQNVFDNKTSYAGEWGVDETLNMLAAQGHTVPIVVAIDHGNETRMQELSPWTNPEFGEARGKAYLDFLVTQVKPFIDRTYRTKPGAMSTTIMGSSMGGLMAHYALVSRPDIFSKAAVFSPSFWYADDVFHFTESAPLPETHRLYMIVGREESDKIINGMQAMADLHAAQQHPASGLKSHVVEGQSHNEAFWQSEVADALIWLTVVK